MVIYAPWFVMVIVIVVLNDPWVRRERCHRSDLRFYIQYKGAKEAYSSTNPSSTWAALVV